MEGTPSDVDYDKLKKAILDCKGVTEVEDLHVWALTSGKNACSVHIRSTTPFETLKVVEDELKFHLEMGIKHLTIQVEYPDKHGEHSKTALHH